MVFRKMEVEKNFNGLQKGFYREGKHRKDETFSCEDGTGIYDDGKWFTENGEGLYDDGKCLKEDGAGPYNDG